MGAYFVPKHMNALCHWWLYDEDSFVGFLFSTHFVYDNGGFEQEQEPHHLGSNHSSTTDKFHDFEEITLPWMPQFTHLHDENNESKYLGSL